MAPERPHLCQAPGARPSRHGSAVDAEQRRDLGRGQQRLGGHVLTGHVLLNARADSALTLWVRTPATEP